MQFKWPQHRILAWVNTCILQPGVHHCMHAMQSDNHRGPIITASTKIIIGFPLISIRGEILFLLTFAGRSFVFPLFAFHSEILVENNEKFWHGSNGFDLTRFKVEKKKPSSKGPCSQISIHCRNFPLETLTLHRKTRSKNRIRFLPLGSELKKPWKVLWFDLIIFRKRKVGLLSGPCSHPPPIGFFNSTYV